jgi:photosystem II stability/assembly factor-like uncharacterized protein
MKILVTFCILKSYQSRIHSSLRLCMIKNLLISFFSVFLFLNTASAQWVKVASALLGTSPSTCCAFGSVANKDGFAWAGRDALFMSSDDGQTWTSISVSFTGSITKIEFFDKNTGVFGTDNGSVHLTTDQGKTWKNIHSGGQCYDLSFCGSSNNIIIVSDYAGLYYTSDQGNNWTMAGTGGHVLCCIGRNDGSALVHNESEIRRTTNFGVSWQSIGHLDYDSWSLALDSSSQDAIYLMNEEGHISADGKASVFRSMDGGTTWTDFEQHNGRFFCGGLAASKNFVYAQTLNNGIYQSNDKGQTWFSICGPSNNIDSRTLSAINDNLLLAVDAEGSIWRLTRTPGTNLSFSLSTAARVNNDVAGVEIYVPIYLKANSAMPSFDMVVHYPAGQLQYVRSVNLNSKIIDVAGGAWTGRAKIHFDAADLAARKDSLIGYSVFKQLPYDNDCSSIKFDSAEVFTSVTPCASVVRISAPAVQSVIGAPKPPNISFSVSTVTRLNEDTVGVEIFVPIYLKATMAMPSFDMEVHYLQAQLEYRRSVNLNSKIIDVFGGAWPGRSKIHFDANDLAARKDSLIGYSVFRQLADDTDCAVVVFDSAGIFITSTPCMSGSSVMAPSVSTIIGAPKRPNLNYSISSKRIINDSLGVIIYLPIYLKANVTMPSFDLIEHYPAGVLSYIKSVSLSGNVVDIPGQQWVGRAKIHFDAADLLLRKDSLIGYTLFNWYPYEYDCAHIIFDSMSTILPSNPCSGASTAASSASEGVIGSSPSCGLAKETDVDAPRFTGNQDARDIYRIDINDGRITDEGLRAITWVAEIGTDTTKIKVLGVIPPILPCYNDKQSHTAKVVQLDSTAAGCYDFTFTDCLGHQSFTKVCMEAHAKSGVAEVSQPLMLIANHPNPFSHITTFTYTLPTTGTAKLYLYDELGKEMRIYDGTQPAGSYSIDFDGSKLSTGNYFIRLECNGKVVTRRVVIER